MVASKIVIRWQRVEVSRALRSWCEQCRARRLQDKSRLVRKEWVRFSVMCASSAIQRLAVQTVEDMQRFASDCRASRQPPLDLPASPVTDASLEGDASHLFVF
eukprot:Tamp_24042.p1 GENE.Tamp_24042~~Tamp_24042.p1  ORF type:complete len:103 (-),score=4.13 Tamp_24042:248-556(-)